MTTIPKKVEDRLTSSLKRFQPILSSAKARDVNESDTVIIVTDLISEVFGYDKYSEISSEHSIRGTFCDLAIKIEGKVQLLVEVKAIGLELKDSHVKQAVDYAANQGVDWVVLTNGITWRIYKISFNKPIDQELVFEIDFLKLSLKNDDDLDYLFLLTKEGWQKQVMVDFAAQRQALSRFFIAGMVLSEPVLDVIRKELKKTCPDVKVKNEQIQSVLLQEVLKREVVEGEKADEARKKILRANNRALRAQDSKETGGNPGPAATVPNPTPPGSSATAQA
ncbi:MAG: type restriction enzyme terminus family protein [Pedosphaera sp.]|nr:type restriction enzyme terminus family protein [Pedosphaera sp.]